MTAFLSFFQCGDFYLIDPAENEEFAKEKL
jgi:hypothetical protein